MLAVVEEQKLQAGVEVVQPGLLTEGTGRGLREAFANSWGVAEAALRSRAMAEVHEEVGYQEPI